jgi:hypothetical protein
LKPELLITKAINTLNRWQEEDEADVVMIAVHTSILEYELTNIDNRTATPVRHGIALAYAILGTEE